MKVVDSATKTKINGIQVTEVDIRALPGRPQTMDAVYALGDFTEQPGAGTDGDPRFSLQHTHGRCSANTNNWSERTMNLLEELISSMEEDLLPRHFEVRAGLEDTNARFEPGSDEEVDQV